LKEDLEIPTIFLAFSFAANFLVKLFTVEVKFLFFSSRFFDFCCS
jgi:hypothetical protein